jgi:bifunctional non-homologous end joining protein LigD
MSLEKYRQKRDFEKTPEPRGTLGGDHAERRYVIQKHAARRLHYDFRLELDGTLKSWAIPRGPSLDPNEKRLAVHVEDHPLEYADFEGIIPPKQYGSGAVLVWDRGVWLPDSDPREGYDHGKLKFRLEGEKLRGGWTLIRMKKASAAEGKENWLLVKEKDDTALTGAAAEITEQCPESVLSGKNIDEIKRSADARPAPAKARSGVRTAPFPSIVKPELATLVDRPPKGDGWLYEVKLDGYRILCACRDGEARLFTRNGNDWTGKLPQHARAVRGLGVDEAWLDGEVVVLARDGTSSFQALQNAFDEARETAIVYYLFDLLYLNGDDLRRVPLLERKQRLASLLERTKDPLLRYSEHYEGDGQTIFEHACLHGLEGLIAKRRESFYLAGRSRDWIKVKCRRRQEFVIGGFTDPKGTRKGLGALLLGVHDRKGVLHYAGKVGTGFNDAGLRALRERMRELEQDRPPFADPPSGAAVRQAHWVQPELVAEVEFAEWTHANQIRQASFLGLREDKSAGAVTREIAASVPRDDDVRSSQQNARSSRRTTASPRARHTATVAGIELTHPERILYPDPKLTKLDLALYYERVAKWILPHLEHRPLTLLRCPQGHKETCFFQKHVGEATPKVLDRVEVDEENGRASYLVANRVEAVIELVQMGVLELHTFGSTVDRLDYPDRMIFDLDPDSGLPWARVVEAAQLTRSLLAELGLDSFVKTTGGKGLHVAVPLQRRHAFDEVKAFSRAVAEHLAEVLPERFTAKMAKAERRGKIFVDYLRNAKGATAVAAYSTRAKRGAPVATPLAWDELSEELDSSHFTVVNIHERLDKLSDDPWAGYFAARQTITSSMRRSLGLMD